MINTSYKRFSYFGSDLVTKIVKISSSGLAHKVFNCANAFLYESKELFKEIYPVSAVGRTNGFSNVAFPSSEYVN